MRRNEHGIYCEETDDVHQMYAKFNMGVIEGVFRFERQGKKEDDSSEEEPGEDSDDDDYDSDRRSPTPEAFYFESPPTQPSAKYPTWNYRWRGNETGENEIELYSDVNVYEITFEKKGTKLTGTFGCAYFKECNFTAVKVDAGEPSSIDISMEWGG
jgi:hypothetical protein